MAVRRKTSSGIVTARTARRRARIVQAEEVAKATQRNKPRPAESMSQAKIWDRKNKRYIIAGLCFTCAAQAAWGHALGFEKIKDPCTECQPIVNGFETPGPRGSKWRKCLIKLEYAKHRQEATA